MPPPDPRLRPGLDRALPADRKPGATEVCAAPEPWLIQFGGQAKKWRRVSVVAWGADTFGREVIDVEWFTEEDGGAWTESYVADRAKMRKRW